MYNYNKGTKYLEKGNVDKALQFLKKAEGDFKEKYLNMGNCYRHFGDDKKAMECYLKANNPDVPYADGTRTVMYTLALNNLGMMEYAFGNDDNAEVLYRHALTIDPLYCDAMWNLSNCLLRQYFSGREEVGKLGWDLYEYRFKKNAPVGLADVLPRWDGVSRGNKIVVLTEQGLGDKIMFGRYLRKLEELFDEVVVQCDKSLDVFYSKYTICRDPLEHIDAVAVPICSLAGIFGIVDEKWLEGKFTTRNFDGFNIGCVWSGSTTHLNNSNRSCPSGHFLDLSSFGSLYSINPGARVPKGIKDISSKDWSETAATVLGLDVVVTVDTSIVHLCGTLGVPCIMLQPLKATDFRWGDGNNVWYSSVKIVRNNGSWDAVFAEVRKLLAEMKNASN